MLKPKSRNDYIEYKLKKLFLNFFWFNGSSLWLFFISLINDIIQDKKPKNLTSVSQITYYIITSMVRKEVMGHTKFVIDRASFGGCSVGLVCLWFCADEKRKCLKGGRGWRDVLDVLKVHVISSTNQGGR